MKAEGTDVRAGRRSKLVTPPGREKNMRHRGCGQIPLAVSGQSPEGRLAGFW